MKFSVDRKNFHLDVDIQIGHKERIGVIGPNGAGKSTLLAQWVASTKTEETTSVLLEQRALCFPHMTVLENVAFAPRAQGMPADKAREHAQHELDRAGLGQYAHHFPEELSGGQQQRVALLRALATHASTVFLDEPLTGLDVDGAREYRHLLSTYDEQLSLVVIATHDPLDLLHLVDRVIVLEEGRCVADMPTSEIFLAPPNTFSARLVECNRVELVSSLGVETTYWFSPRDAVLSSSTSQSSTHSAFQHSGTITSVDRYPHHIHYEVLLHTPMKQRVSVISEKENPSHKAGDSCVVSVTGTNLRKSG